MSVALGLIPAIGPLVSSALHFGLTFGLAEHPCDEGIKKYGIVMGSLFLVLAVILFATAAAGLNFGLSGFTSATAGVFGAGAILTFIVGLAMLGVFIWGSWLLFRPEGIACWNNNKSKLWLAYVILFALTVLFMLIQAARRLLQ